MIKIHYDFTDGSEKSYIEGHFLKDNFNTHCLDFFTTDYMNTTDVIIINSKGEYISRNELMSNNGKYTIKEIRNTHNILRMFKANSFKWQIKSDIEIFMGENLSTNVIEYINKNKLVKGELEKLITRLKV